MICDVSSSSSSPLFRCVRVTNGLFSFTNVDFHQPLSFVFPMWASTIDKSERKPVFSTSLIKNRNKKKRRRRREENVHIKNYTMVSNALHWYEMIIFIIYFRQVDFAWVTIFSRTLGPPVRRSSEAVRLLKSNFKKNHSFTKTWNTINREHETSKRYNI